MDSTYVLYEIADRVGVITLNRPEASNAISGTMREDLLQALQRAEADPTVRCVLLTGAGRAFCAGGDITSMVELQARHDTAPITDRLTVAAQVIQQIRHMPNVVIAAVNGELARARFNLALACDIRWGSQ